MVAKLVRLARSGNTDDVQWKAVELLGTLFMQDFEDFKDDDGSLREVLIGVFLNHPSHCARSLVLRALAYIPSVCIHSENIAETPGFLEKLVDLPSDNLFYMDGNPWWLDFIKMPDSLSKSAGFLTDNEAGRPRQRRMS